MTWQEATTQFVTYLKLTRLLADNSIAAYCSDLKKLQAWASPLGPSAVQPQHLRGLLGKVCTSSQSPATQVRLLSSIKMFYRFLVDQHKLQESPADLLRAPALPRKLPTVLAVHEIEALIQAIDHHTPLGMRNRAIVEVLYGSGLRVGELVDLRLSHVHADTGFLRVWGKGQKERWVPIGQMALKHMQLYLTQVRHRIAIQKPYQNHVFVSHKGKKLSRTMIFRIIQNLGRKANLNKSISPHTLRHAFATHLVEGGANLKAVQSMLGHASITTTEIYTHLDTHYLKQVIAAHHPMSRPVCPKTG